MLAVAGLAAGGTLLPFTLFAYAQGRVSPEVAGAFLNLEPLVGAVAGVVLFGDPAGPAQLAGGAAILAGIALSSLPLLATGRRGRSTGERHQDTRRPRPRRDTHPRQPAAPDPAVPGPAVPEPAVRDPAVPDPAAQERPAREAATYAGPGAPGGPSRGCTGLPLGTGAAASHGPGPGRIGSGRCMAAPRQATMSGARRARHLAGHRS